MNVIVVPDASMIVIPLIEKNGHTYLSPSNFSRYDNMDICEGNFTFDNLITKYSSSELPSGVRGRLFLFSKIIPDADAAIIIGKRPRYRERMYDSLNDLILFGGNACNNAHSLEVKIVEDLNIPTLKLAFPTNQKELIDLIDKTNHFLKNLENIQGTVNCDNLSADLSVKKQKASVIDVKKTLDNLI
ncbi:methanogeneis marker protein 5 [Methanobrevibacter sp. YE315]|uniref:DUF2112 family protein n=1 Tax=Methanobrevibacter sp. YE315 TaxID=1609968 RepID=UPI000764EB66|nr:DUF2112 family protein [Methanobrevibacter sp. YE315]AMD18492.1 methanogeneis marker protein 5 [Methanobrevibacter sp. YE315]